MFSRIINNIFKRESTEKVSVTNKQRIEKQSKPTPSRIGELGEYKINIQLDQLPKNSKYLSDVLIENNKAKSGYSQIDHVIFTPFAIFVVETKNYSGTIYGDRSRTKWSVNGKFPMMNPFNQNYGHIQAIKGVLEIEGETQFVSMVSFTKRCTFKVSDELRKIQSNDLIVYDIELSEYITRKINILKLQNPEPIYSTNELQNLYNKIKSANITDLYIRDKHVETLKEKDRESIKNENHLSNCKTCGNPVSEKVKKYCLLNKTRFKGNIYCFEHQKLL
ncbi:MULTISPECIES: nuclease-related domain-containing protein [Psychrobacillus]|uniref:NERD domain-containing protein n=1 Tax=Psychrobacillus faecigallinarum TaxID=2762235 RepID=A0ABR8RDE9_9BACI|nr:nuclease-related domain-containing protein [Psychrobacillus faecigallinarum]MBD7945812.1 NERD domain-containing protein [Psychrobacillus faecigallinarum]